MMTINQMQMMTIEESGRCGRSDSPWRHHVPVFRPSFRLKRVFEKAVCKGRAVMIGRFPHLSAFSKKFLEVCGAALASAVVAGLLGQTDKPATPLSPVVYLSPADAQMIKLMHNDQAALLERLRSPSETRATPPVGPIDTPAAQPAAASPQPKPTPATANRREPKLDRAPALATVTRRSEEPSPAVTVIPGKPAQIAAASSPGAPAEAREPRNVPLPVAVAEAADWVSALKQIPGWFWPAGGGLLSEAPRPPMPVGNLLPHVM
jgi:hypothetical protein